MHLRIALPTSIAVAALTACGAGTDQAQQTVPASTSSPQVRASEVAALDQSLEARVERGEALYKQHCVACHQAMGQGLAGAFPPLAGADYLIEDPERAIAIVLGGKSGEITVNGATYNAVMPALAYLGDQQIADVLTYTLNAWGNDGGEVAVAQVTAARGE